MHYSQIPMSTIHVLMALISGLLFSYGGYQKFPVSAEYLSSLNDSVSNGQKNGAIWANSPEEITRHFSPPVSHDGASKRYEVNKKTNSSAGSSVTATEEGPIDDEVLGERYTLYIDR